MRECEKALDSLGIAPCGHMARERGIVIKVYASCQPDQKAAEPCYSVEGVTVDEDGTLKYDIRKQASETQTFHGVNFTKLVCCRGPEESCRSEEALKNWKWQEAVSGGLRSRLFIVQGKDQGRPAWHYVLLSKESEAYKKKFLERAKSGHINVAEWGYIIKSQWGNDPPEDLQEKLSKLMVV